MVGTARTTEYESCESKGERERARVGLKDYLFIYILILQRNLRLAPSPMGP